MRNKHHIDTNAMTQACTGNLSNHRLMMHNLKVPEHELPKLNNPLTGPAKARLTSFGMGF